MSTGYFHPEYADAIVDNAQITALKKAKGWLLNRQIPHSCYYDLTSCYPLMCCHDWSKIIEDLQEIPEQVTAVSLVTDPFAQLNKKFSHHFDTFSLFKEHYIVDLSIQSKYKKHHRYEIRRSLKKGIEVHHCEQPSLFIKDWQKLYCHLISRHKIKKNLQFSQSLFNKQFNLPGLAVFRACINDQTIGMALWYVSDEKAYYHLAANSDMGYNNGCAYALMDYSLHFLRTYGVKEATLGAGPGIKKQSNDGLSRFKSGWANYTKPVYFAGKIMNNQAYNQVINQSKNNPEYFPAYRSPNE